MIATHLLLLMVVCFEVVTLFCGAANADAHIAIDMATVANLVTVVMTQGCSFLWAKARKKSSLGIIPDAENVQDGVGPDAHALHCCACRPQPRAFRKLRPIGPCSFFQNRIKTSQGR